MTQAGRSGVKGQRDEAGLLTTDRPDDADRDWPARACVTIRPNRRALRRFSGGTGLPTRGSRSMGQETRATLVAAPSRRDPWWMDGRGTSEFFSGREDSDQR